MEVSDKELWKMLNAAWIKGSYGWCDLYGWIVKYSHHGEAIRSRRYRDVSRIIKEAEKAKEKP